LSRLDSLQNHVSPMLGCVCVNVCELFLESNPTHVGCFVCVRVERWREVHVAVCVCVCVCCDQMSVMQVKRAMCLISGGVFLFSIGLFLFQLFISLGLFMGMEMILFDQEYCSYNCTEECSQPPKFGSRPIPRGVMMIRFMNHSLSIIQDKVIIKIPSLPFFPIQCAGIWKFFDHRRIIFCRSIHNVITRSIDTFRRNGRIRNGWNPSFLNAS
jgi:hypothetical protein